MSKNALVFGLCHINTAATILLMIDGIKPPRQRPAGGLVVEPPKHAEPVFLPPEAFAELEPKAPVIDTQTIGVLAKKRRFHWPLRKKPTIILAFITLLLIGGGGAAAYQLQRTEPQPAPVASAPPAPLPEPPKPVIITSPLTGNVTTAELAALPVTGVMIENSPDARPQSGLKDAGIVYEAIAEGGITRFLALFQESKPDYVGPVRSVRPYYLDWVQGYDAAIAHVGGSPEALAKIKSEGIKDLDQFYNAGAYQRVRTRYAPHNVYTSLDNLLKISTDKGFTKSNFTGFARKAATPSTAPTARSIDLTLSGYLYNVHYDYDAATNSYKRSEGGRPHLDERSGAQLSPNVVVALVVPFAIQADRIHSDYETIGSGKAYIFQDGTVTEGIWEKKSSKEPLRLGNANGSPLAINAGQTWLTAIKQDNQAAYKP